MRKPSGWHRTRLSPRRVELGDLRGKCRLGLLRDGVEISTPSRGDHRCKDAFDEGCRREAGRDTRLGQQLDRQFGTQYGRTEVHDHHHAVAVVGGDDGVGHLCRIGAKAIIIRGSRCDLDPRSGTVHHLQRQVRCRVGEVRAVGDHNNPHHFSVAPPQSLHS